MIAAAERRMREAHEAVTSRGELGTERRRAARTGAQAALSVEHRVSPTCCGA